MPAYVPPVDEPPHELARGRGRRAQARIARHHRAQHEPVEELRDLVDDPLGSERVAEGLLVAVLVNGSLEALQLGIREVLWP
jgi:hypothetical protein